MTIRTTLYFCFCKIILITFCSVFNTYAQTTEVDTSYNQVYTYFLTGIQNQPLSDATKEKIASLCTSKIKKAFPYGLNGVSQEQFNESEKICIKETFKELNDPNVRYWIIAKESNVYKGLENKFKNTILMDNKNLKKLLNCSLGNLFIQYPKGLDSLPESERYNALYNFGYECMKGIEIQTIRWSPDLENMIRLKINSNLEKNNISQSQKSIYINCFIEKMKGKYPEGLSGNLEKEMADVMTSCMKKTNN